MKKEKMLNKINEMLKNYKNDEELQEEYKAIKELKSRFLNCERELTNEYRYNAKDIQCMTD